jgi:hypothetical protein
VALLEASSLESWRGWQLGTRIALPDFVGGEVEAEVGLMEYEGGWLRVGGPLRGRAGSFSLHTNFQQLAGHVLFPSQNVAWEIRTERSGEWVLVEKRLEAVVCVNLSVPEPVQPVAATASDFAAGTQDILQEKSISEGATVPFIQTRPGAKGVVFLDFDGESVTDPDWNKGATIFAEPSIFTPTQIRQIVDRVVEDYAPFDLTFTTDRAAYVAAPVGRRMRVIVTPTVDANSFAPRSVEGIAYVDSWSRAGMDRKTDIPAWAFDISRSPKTVAEVISHELGHTLGLSHDGQISGGSRIENYPGAPDSVGNPVGWAPIMGKPYTRPLTQWSKGEYLGANNTEDDLAILSKNANGFGYVPPSPSETVSLPLACSADAFDVSGTLRSASQPHLFRFETSGGTYAVLAKPSSPAFTNVDVRLELLNAQGEPLARSDVPDALGAALSGTLAAGTYQFRVSAAGSSDPPQGGYVGGYSSYASLGSFHLTGIVGGVFQRPYFLPQTLHMRLGETFSGSLPVAGASEFSLAPDTLPDGIQLDPATGALTGVPGTSGSWSLAVVASNSLGVTAGTVQLSVEAHSRSLDSVLGLGDACRLLSTTVQAPWSTTYGTCANGQRGWMAVSGLTAHNASSSLRFLVSLPLPRADPVALTFWCKTSSEFQKDFLECRVNGRLVPDLVTSLPIRISGESRWTLCRVLLPTRVSLIDLRYVKDASLSENQDRVWVHGFEIGELPVIQMLSRPVRIRSGGDFEISARVSGATALRWIRDGFPLGDSTSDERSVRGATGDTLSIRGASVWDAGLYRLEASNAYGRIQNTGIRVIVDGAPQIGEIPGIPDPIQSGGMLLLPVRVGGSPPLRCVWTRDGVTVQAGPQPSLQRMGVKPSASGNYVLRVSNRFGSVSSREVPVVVLPE